MDLAIVIALNVTNGSLRALRDDGYSCVESLRGSSQAGYFLNGTEPLGVCAIACTSLMRNGTGFNCSMACQTLKCVEICCEEPRDQPCEQLSQGGEGFNDTSEADGDDNQEGDIDDVQSKSESNSSGVNASNGTEGNGPAAFSGDEPDANVTDANVTEQGHNSSDADEIDMNITEARRTSSDTLENATDGQRRLLQDGEDQPCCSSSTVLNGCCGHSSNCTGMQWHKNFSNCSVRKKCRSCNAKMLVWIVSVLPGCLMQVTCYGITVHDLSCLLWSIQRALI